VPKRLTWDLTDAHLKDFFWLSVDNPAKGQSIDVKIDSNNATVRSEKISAFSLWLDSRLVNLAEPVNVTVNGKALTFKLTPTLATLCESIQRRGDVNLAASCKIDVSP